MQLAFTVGLIITEFCSYHEKMLSACVDLRIWSNPVNVGFQCDKKNCYMQDSKALNNYGNVNCDQILFSSDCYSFITEHVGSVTGGHILLLFWY
jgi:hypothetical protein